MLITLQDDGVLRVYERVADAVRDVEALDAEEVFRAVFDDLISGRFSAAGTAFDSILMPLSAPLTWAARVCSTGIKLGA